MAERSIYRIIDANFNRSREAIRMIEEFCRFTLNSGTLTERAKQLRHQLCSVITKIDSGSLLSARDTTADVGLGKTVQSQLKRANLKDTLTAGCKRLTEALRVLAETIQSIDPDAAQKIENLRYGAYTLEKDIFLFSDPAEKFKKVRLYIIISEPLPADALNLTCRCVQASADCIQLRLKDIQDDKFFSVAEEMVNICKDAGVISIINDRIDIAVASGADGVHLGQNDLSIQHAHKLQLSPMIIGLSTHSASQLEDAINQLPTYIALGPVFSTDTKPDAQAVGLDYVRKATTQLGDTGIAHVAIGGIDEDNISSVLDAGAKTIAVCSAVTAAKDPTAACKTLKQIITKSRPHE